MTTSNVIILDLGISNTASLQHALRAIGHKSMIVYDPDDLPSHQPIILPGVGSFQAAMKRLNGGYWRTALNEHVQAGDPLLGICLGMQILAEQGNEPEPCEGLGYIPSRVVRLEPKGTEKIPHVGWNTLHIEQDDRLFEDLEADRDVYFIHSYHMIDVPSTCILGTTPYCQTIVSCVRQGSVYGCQFHPEKSSKTGLTLLKNFLAL